MNSIREKPSVLYYSQCCESTLTVSVWLIQAPCPLSPFSSCQHYNPAPTTPTPAPPAWDNPYSTCHVISSHTSFSSLWSVSMITWKIRSQNQKYTVLLIHVKCFSKGAFQIFNLEKCNHLLMWSCLISVHWSTFLKPWLTVKTVSESLNSSVHRTGSPWLHLNAKN